ncbi:MAG: outer membrane lipoprotein carrier protein LolA [Treponema sp.]|nr:outer membrane lipoprotein carrier protein LolA [Treponema sp.]
MNRKIKFVLSVIALSFVFCANSFAAGLTVQDVCKQLAVNPVTKGDFTQIKAVNSAKGKRELKSSGVYLFCVDGIVWETKKPFPSSMIVTPSVITQVGADGSKKEINAKDNQSFASIASTLVAIFSNDLSLLQKNFTVDFKAAADNSWEMNLLPKDSTISSVVGKIVLKGKSNGKSTSLDSIILTENGGNTVTYQFTNQTYSKELTSDEKAKLNLK